jgi:hypothetical protein
MNKRGWCLFTLMLLTVTIYAQDMSLPRKGGFQGKGPPDREMHQLRFARHILTEKSIEEAQITPEQVQKLRNEFDMIDRQMTDIGMQIGEASKNQAEIAVRILTTPGGNADEMFKMTERIGRLRTEQAKLSVKVLLVIRDTLRPEQCAKVVDMMREEREKMHKRMDYMRERMQNRRGGPREEEL